MPTEDPRKVNCRDPPLVGPSIVVNVTGDSSVLILDRMCYPFSLSAKDLQLQIIIHNRCKST